VSASGAGPPTIGENVWLGPDCVIYGDSRLGNGVTVLPGTILSMNVPDNAVVGDNPAGIMRLGFDNSELRRNSRMPQCARVAGIPITSFLQASRADSHRYLDPNATSARSKLDAVRRNEGLQAVLVYRFGRILDSKKKHVLLWPLLAVGWGAYALAALVMRKGVRH
jgi:hypothetical protein